MATLVNLVKYLSLGWLQYNKESNQPLQTSDESLLTDSAFVKSNDRSKGKCEFCKQPILPLPDSDHDDSTKLFCCHDYQQFVQEFIRQGVSEETLQAVLAGRDGGSDRGKEGKEPELIDIRSQCMFEGGKGRRESGAEAAERCVVFSRLFSVTIGLERSTFCVLSMSVIVHNFPGQFLYFSHISLSVISIGNHFCALSPCVLSTSP